MSNDQVNSQSGRGDVNINESQAARRSVYGGEGLSYGQSGSAAGGGGGSGSGGGTGYSGQTASGTAMMTYKVREFEWFEVETKIRKFVNELLQPTIKKVSLDKRLLEEINERITANDEQVKGLYDFIHYTHNRVKVLDDIHEKIAQTNSGLEMAMNRNKQHEEKVQLFEDNLKREFNSMKSEVASVLKAKDQLSEDRRTLMEYFENFKRNTQDIISSLTKELSDQQSATKTEFIKSWDSILKQQNITQQHTSDLVIHSDKMSDIFQRISAFKVKNTQYDNQLDRMEKEIDSLQKNISIAKKFTNKVEDLQNKFRMVENYIEKYSAMYVQGQISDTLFNVLESKAQKKRLLTFEEQVFISFNYLHPLRI